MKILLLTSTYPRFSGDGTGSFIRSISKELVKRGHELIVIAPDNHLVDKLWHEEVDVVRIKFIYPNVFARLGYGESLRADIFLKWYSFALVSLYLIFAFIYIVSSHRCKNVEIIYAHWLLPSGALGVIISKLFRVPLVLHLHGSDVYVAERYLFFKPIAKLILKSATKVIACSADLAERAKKICGCSQLINVIPYGVDTHLFSKSDQHPNNHHKSTIVITAIGRLVNKKGFNYLIEAAPQVLKKFPFCTFKIAGDGDQMTELVNHSKRLGIENNIEFLGGISWSEVPSLLKSTDIFVLPSVIDERGNVDGLPVVLLEAMASSCAIIASSIGGVPEVIVNGENGILVEQKDVTQLSDSIIEVIEKGEDYIKKLGKSARETVENRYSWGMIIKRIEEILWESL